MFAVSGVLLVLERTGSAPLAGITSAAAVLPAALSGPFLGAWLDVARRRRTLIVIDQLTSVVALAAIVALAGRGPDWTLPVVAVLYSVTRPFSSGSFFSALAELAGPELLDHASMIEASSLNLSFVVGPALAGAIAGAAGAATAVWLQAAITLVVAGLIAVNPAFEAHADGRAEGVRDALKHGRRALARSRVLRVTATASTLAAFGWGLMAVGFPLYAVQMLGAGASASGFLWAAIAGGSILGTFALPGGVSLRRIALSYAILGASALLWPLAGTLAVGIALVGLTGVLEGPAYSGTIAMRQRHTPPAVRAQLMTTVTSVAMAAGALGSAAGGAIHDPLGTIVVFTAVNLVAALVARGAGGRVAGDG